MGSFQAPKGKIMNRNVLCRRGSLASRDSRERIEPGSGN